MADAGIRNGAYPLVLSRPLAFYPWSTPMLRTWLRSLFARKTTTTTKSMRPTKRAASFKPGIESLEIRELLSTGLAPGYSQINLGGVYDVYRAIASGQTLVYSGAQSVVQMAVVGQGVDTLFSGGGVYFSPDGQNLGGDGNTYRAYTGSTAITDIVPVPGGLLTRFATAAVYFDTDPTHLGGGGVGSSLAYSGNATVEQIIPVTGGLLTRFNTGAVYFDTDPRRLGGGGVGSGLAYQGSAAITQIIPVPGGLLTRFTTGAVYFDTDPRHLGGGGVGSMLAYKGNATVEQIIPVTGGLLTRFSTGAVYFDTDPRHLGGGGVGSSLAYSGQATVAQIIPVTGGLLTRFSTGAVYFDTDPRHLGGGGAGSALAYSGSAKILQIVPLSGGLLSLFSTGTVYFDTDPRHLGGGGAGSLRIADNVSAITLISGRVFSLGTDGTVYNIPSGNQAAPIALGQMFRSGNSFVFRQSRAQAAVADTICTAVSIANLGGAANAFPPAGVPLDIATLVCVGWTLYSENLPGPEGTGGFIFEQLTATEIADAPGVPLGTIEQCTIPTPPGIYWTPGTQPPLLPPLPPDGPVIAPAPEPIGGTSSDTTFDPGDEGEGEEFAVHRV